MSKKKFVSGFAVKLLVVAACFAASFSVSGQQGTQPAADKTVPPVAVAPVAAATSKTPATLTTNDDDRYRIGPGDILDIRILNRPNLSREAVRVEGSGMIRMPLIDTEIQAACLTEGELAKEISTRYARFYKNLQV